MDDIQEKILNDTFKEAIKQIQEEQTHKISS